MVSHWASNILIVVDLIFYSVSRRRGPISMVWNTTNPKSCQVGIRPGPNTTNSKIGKVLGIQELTSNPDGTSTETS